MRWLILCGFFFGLSTALKLIPEQQDIPTDSKNTIYSALKTGIEGEQQKDVRQGNPIPVAMETPGGADGRMGSSFCDYCVEIIGIAERLFSDPQAEAEVADMFKSVFCPSFSKLQVVCNWWIGAYLPDIMKHLANRSSPRQFCINSEYCPATVSASSKPDFSLTASKNQVSLRAAAAANQGSPVVLATVAKLQGREGDSLCSYCLQLLNAIKRAFSDKQATADLTQQTKPVCLSLTNLTVPCEHWVELHMPDVFAMLASEIEPTVWCSAAFGPSCGPANVAFVSAKSAAGNLPNHGNVQKLKETDGICDMCQAAVKEAKDLLSDPTYRSEIMQFIKDYICTIVPQDKSKCDSAVDNYGPVILQLLLMNLNPVSFCQLITLCPKAATSAGRRGPRGFGQRPLECGTCRVAAALMRKALSDSKNQAAVLTAVRRRMCGVVPGEESKCGSSVDTYGAVILQQLVSRLEPELICPLLGACPEVPVATKVPVASANSGQSASVGSELQCKMCQAAVVFLQTRVRNDNATRAHVLANAESFCQYLPAANRTGCHNFIHRHAIEVFLDVNPYRYCKSIELCSVPPSGLSRPDSGSHAARGDASLLRHHGNEEAAVPMSHWVEEPMARAEKTLL